MTTAAVTNEKPAQIARFVFDQVQGLVSLVDAALEDGRAEAILGAEIAKVFASSKGKTMPNAVTWLALLSDCLLVADAAISADGRVDPAEIELVQPLVDAAARFYARARKSYRELSVGDAYGVEAFLRYHASDSSMFGGACPTTQWLGLDICHRASVALDDPEIVAMYEMTMLRLMDEIISLGGISDAEARARSALRTRIAKKRRRSEQPLAPDGRLAAFCSPNAPEVFHAIAHQNEIWRRDPFDVETIHSAARRVFEGIVSSAQDGAAAGRLLLVLGESGSGKTHLMRAFRNVLHRERAGYAGYLQMSARTDRYDRYILRSLIDGLERPYDEGEVPDSSLMCLSNHVVEATGVVDTEALELLRAGELGDEALARLVSTLADELVQHPDLSEIDIDILRALLFYQRREPRVSSRVLKYLRCEPLGRFDLEVLGDLAPRSDDDAPLRMMVQLGKIAWAAGRGSLVLLIDQLEDLQNVDDPAGRFRRAMDVLRHVTDMVPSSTVVVSCLEDFWKVHRSSLSRAVVDRIENDPEPVRLSTQRSLEEIEAIVALRLSHLYDHMDVRWREEEPIFPFAREQLEQLRNMRTRDVLDRCRTYRMEAVRAGALPESWPSGITTPSGDEAAAPDELDRAFEELLASDSVEVPDDESERIELLAWALGELGASATVDEEFLQLDHGSGARLVAVCDRKPQGGALLRQLEKAARKAGERPLIVLRSSDYPTSSSKTTVRLGELLADGATREVVREHEWRRILGLRLFLEASTGRPHLEAWRRSSNPLRAMSWLVSLLDGSPAQMAPVTQPELPLSPPPAAPSRIPNVSAPPRGGAIVVGDTPGLEPKPVLLELGSLTRHAAFLGSTGSGKTTLALNIVEHALLSGVSVTLVDRKGDLVGYAVGRTELGEDPNDPERGARWRALMESVDVRIFTPGEPRGAPLSIPVVPAGMAELPSYEQSKVARFAASALASMMRYRDNQGDRARVGILARAIELIGRTSQGDRVALEALIDLVHTADPALVEAIGRLDTKHFAKLVDHLETLRITTGTLLMPSEHELDPELLFGRGAPKPRLTIISTKFLGDSATVDFWVSRLLVEIGRWASKNPSKSLQALLMFDEADIYLPATSKPATKEPMLDLMKRARSAGIGLMLATQSPGDLDYKCRDNVATWFVGRVAERTAVDKMKPLLSECRTNVAPKLATAATGQFFRLSGGDVTEIQARRSLLKTEQLPEDVILELARARLGFTPSSA